MTWEKLPEQLLVAGFVVAALVALLHAASKFIRETAARSGRGKRSGDDTPLPKLTSPTTANPVDRISHAELETLTDTGRHIALGHLIEQHTSDLEARLERVEEKLQQLDSTIGRLVGLLERLEQENRELREAMTGLTVKLAQLETSLKYIEKGRPGARS